MTDALIVVDVQESFRRLANWADISRPDIAERAALLAGHARARGDLVVWVLHAEPGTGTVFDPACGHVRLLAGLDPREGEPVLTKTAHNAFTTTTLAQTLTARGIRSVRVAGIRTEQCCETTTRVGADLGFAMTFVSDATATTPLPHWRTAAVLDAATLTERTEWVLAGRFARIATLAEVTGVG